MKIIYKDSTSAKVELNQNELLIISGALNEVCNGIAVFEFETRIGAARVEAENFKVRFVI